MLVIAAVYMLSRPPSAVPVHMHVRRVLTAPSKRDGQVGDREGRAFVRALLQV